MGERRLLTNSVGPLRKIGRNTSATLTQLANLEPAQIIIIIRNSNSWLNDIVNSSALRVDMDLIVTVIASACKATMHRKDMLAFITDLLHSRLISEHLPNYLNRVPHMDESGKLAFLKNIVMPLKSFLKTALAYTLAIEKLDPCINSFHSGLEAVLQKLPSSETAEGEEYKDEYQEILTELGEMQKTIQKMCIEVEKKANVRRNAGIGKPPGNSRHIPITPTIVELKEDVEPFLRESNISGQYLDGEHYLDVQFRLLREGLVGPLREGIAKYRQLVGAAATGTGASKALVTVKELNIYRQVKLHQVEFTETGKIHVLQLCVSSLHNVEWENCKRLQLGSLLCISPDDFVNIALATVVRRKVEHLKNGQLGVQIIEGISVLDSPKFSRSEFILADSPSCFEAVGPILRELQALEGDQLPFSKYIIELNPNMDPPKYATPEIVYDLSPLLHKHGKDNKLWVPILHADKWPNEDEFGFDDSQLHAFKQALTKQLAIIQGPAGTGKTFLGLKIVKTLLHNCDAWITRVAPILILCYNNNALDRFLEGILEQVGPNGVVRVGGSSRSKKLEQYNLKEMTKKLREAETEEEIIILSNATIVGITTTDAAKYQAVLHRIRPQIVIVEEAAEVLEADIVTLLTKDCDHLILIGGHQQLRTNPNVYKLAKSYNLDVSLFERLIRNGIPYESLKVQHRMRPEIAGLLAPNIYKELYNDPSVELRPPVKGVGHNLYFVSHGIHEKNAWDSKSKENRFEADYAAALCRHLILQGYEGRQITVLSTYEGQMLQLQNEMSSSEFQGVTITVVDNYQGEENDIVILSLVSSNVECQIGILNVENSIYVALTRSRNGLFAIGNFDFLVENCGHVWKPIVNHIAQTGLIGSSLRLVCQKHSDFTIEANTAADFKLAPEGGCHRPCRSRMHCGHRCSLLCHSYDPEHEIEKKRCRKRCVKQCKRGHNCQQRCCDECKCFEEVEGTFKNCDHIVTVKCYELHQNFKCPEICSKVLKCGHICRNKCADNCEYMCQVEVDGQCEHVKVKCCEKNSYAHTKCSIACSQKLSCGHACSGTCDDCHQGRFHKQCKEKCSRVLVCGHPCGVPCAVVCPPCTRKCANSCSHAKCSNRCGLPCKPCLEKCPWQCDHYKCTKPCSMECDRPPCQEPCILLLDCGHQCIGMCGEPCPRFCRICDRRLAWKFLFGGGNKIARYVLLEDCGHIIEVKVMDKWIKDDGEETEHKAVNMKGCPKCKTVIRRSLRYGNQLKKMQMNVQEIKKRIIDQMHKKELWKSKIKTKLQTTSALTLGTIKTNIEQSLARHLIPGFEYILLDNLATFANRMNTFYLFIDAQQNVSRQRSSKTRLSSIADRIMPIESWLLEMVPLQEKQYGTEQQLNDVARELYRVAFFIKLFQMLYTKPRHKPIEKLYGVAMSIIDSTKPFTTDQENAVKNIITEMNEIRGYPEITNMRSFQIVKAIGMNNGVWFTCPNGHIYMNTDCNETLIAERCNECQQHVHNIASQEAKNKPAHNHSSIDPEHK